MQTSKKEATEYGQKRTPIFTVFGIPRAKKNTEETTKTKNKAKKNHHKK